MSPITEKSIAAIQYYVNILKRICHSDLETFGNTRFLTFIFMKTILLIQFIAISQKETGAM